MAIVNGYDAYVINPDILSEYNVDQSGEVVSAEVWKALWDLVLGALIKYDRAFIDIYRTLTDLNTELDNCIQRVDRIEEIYDALAERMETLEKTWTELQATYNKIAGHYEDIKDIHDALKEGLVHYGVDAPTLKYTKLWVVPTQFPFSPLHDVVNAIITSRTDSELDEHSENPVQNKVIVKYLENLKTEIQDDLDEVTDYDEEINTLQDRIGKEEIIIPAWTVGKRIVEDGSIVNSGTALAMSDFINLTDGKVVVSGVRSYSDVSMPSIHYYDADGNHVGYVYADGEHDCTRDIAANSATSIRLSHFIKTAYPLEAVRVTISKDSIFQSKEDALTTEDVNEILDGKVAVSRSSQFVNILEGYQNYYENGKYIGSGTPISHTNWVTMMEYVPVEAEATYSFKFKEQLDKWVDIAIAYYDADKNVISTENKTNNLSITTPINCAYIRFSVTNTNYDATYGHDDFDTLYIEKIEGGGSQVVVVDNAPYYSGVFPFTTLSGKRWTLFGDSITENNIRSNANYHDYVRAETGIITINNALGGSGFKNRDDNNNAFYQIAMKTVDSWKNADVITIMGGVNDIWSQITTNGLGNATDVFVEPTDITTATSNTLMACFNKMLDYIIENAPNSRIGVISPLPCYTTQNGKQYEEVPYLAECNMNLFVEECKKACALKGIPYLDLFHNSGLRPWDSTFNARYFKCISADSPDGLHPNELGHKFIFPMVREFVKALI